MDLRPAEITSILKKEIESYQGETSMQSVGTVLSVGDGTARVYGFVTQYTLDDIDNGTYQYPHMKMQQIIHFHETYERNLEA